MRLRQRSRPTQVVEGVLSYKCSEQPPYSTASRKTSLVPSLFFAAFFIGFLCKWHQLASISSKLGILQEDTEQKERESRITGFDSPVKTTPLYNHNDDGLQPRQGYFGDTTANDEAPHNQNHRLVIKERRQKVNGDRRPEEDRSIPGIVSRQPHLTGNGTKTDGGVNNNLQSSKDIRKASSIIGLAQQKGNKYPLASLPRDGNKLLFVETQKETLMQKRPSVSLHPDNPIYSSSWNQTNDHNVLIYQGTSGFQRQKNKYSVAAVSGARNDTKAISEKIDSLGWRNQTQSQHQSTNRATTSDPVSQHQFNEIETASTLPEKKAAADDQEADEAQWEQLTKPQNWSGRLVQPVGKGSHHNNGNIKLDAEDTVKSDHSSTENEKTHLKNGNKALDVEDAIQSNKGNVEKDSKAFPSHMAEVEVTEEADSGPVINRGMASLWNKFKSNQLATTAGNVRSKKNASASQPQLSTNRQPATNRTIHNYTNTTRNVAYSRVQGFQRQRVKFSVTVLGRRNTTKPEEPKLLGATMGAGERKADIAVFYNLFIPFNKTGDELQLAFAAIREQIGQIGSSTQSQVLLSIVNIGQTIEEEMVQDICANYKHLTCTRKRYYEKGFEDLTLAALYDHCQENGNDEVIYVHNKGSFHSQLQGGWGYIRQDVWRRMGTMAAASELCLKPLNDDTCDFCGLIATPLPWLHVPGNFWSARCSYIQKLLHPQKYQNAMNQYRQEVAEPSVNNGSISMVFQIRGKRCFGDERWAAENWIGSHPSVRPCDLANVSDISHWQKVDRNSSQFSFSLAPRQNMEYMMSKSLPRIPPRVLKRPYLRLRDFHLLGGMIHRWQRFYNLTTADVAPWVWKYYPDAQAWQEALEKHGNRAFEVVTNNVSS